MQDNRYLPIGEAANFLGVSIGALRKFEETGKIVPLKTLSGERRYSFADLQKVALPPVTGLPDEALAKAGPPSPRIANVGDKLLTIKQVAAKLGISTKTVRRMLGKGELQAAEQGKNRRLLILESEANKFSQASQTYIGEGLLTIQQAAEKLLVSSKTIRRLVATGRLHPAERGRYGTILLSTTEVAKILRGNQQQSLRPIALPALAPSTQAAQISATRLFFVNSLAILVWLVVLGSGIFLLTSFGPESIKNKLAGLADLITGQRDIVFLTREDAKTYQQALITDYLRAENGNTVNYEVFFLEGASFGQDNNTTIDSIGAITTSEPITITDTSTSSLEIGGGMIAGTGNVYIIDRSGRIPALTSTYIADLDATKLTGKIDNADHLDNIDSSSFLRSNESDTAEGAINFTASPGSVNVGGGPVYINPAASQVNYTLLGVAINNSSRFKVDAEGDTSIAGTLGAEGATTLSSTLGVTGNTTLSGTLGVTGNSTLTGDLAINGGDLTTSATTFNLLNSTATTLNIGGAATTLSVGASTGTTTINNNLTVTGTATLSSNTAVLTGGQLTLTRNPTQAHTGTWAIGSSTWHASNATIYANPASPTADSNIFALAKNDAVQFAVDAEGDIYGNNLILAGTTTTGTTNVVGDLGIEGNTTIGDTTTDTLTLNPATLTWVGGVSASNTLRTIDITGAGTRTLTLLNSTASQVADLNLSDGDLQLGGTVRISNAGAVTAVGVNSGAGLLQGALGLTVTGAAVSLNASSNFDVNIATGTSTGDITLGGGTAGQLISINSDDWDISTTGAMTGIGAITSDGLIQTTLTTEQLRLRYDTSNYASFTVGSTGVLTIDATGTAVGLTVSDALTVSGASITASSASLALGGAVTGATTITATGLIQTTLTTEQLRLRYDASNYTSFTTDSGGDLTINTTGNNVNITDDVAVTTVATSGTGVNVVANTVTTGAAVKIDADALTTGNVLEIEQDNRDMFAINDRDVTVGGHTDLTTIANINDIFVYDTTKDTDGGRWRNDERAKASSWYNETIDATGAACNISTNDRCGTREFPKKAIIVAANAGIYIFDAKDNTMFMKFTGASNNIIRAASNTVFALNGVLYSGTSGASGFLHEIDFVGDKASETEASIRVFYVGRISQRNDALNYGSPRVSLVLVNRQVNDVHAAVVDGKTYVAVATDGGVSIINETDTSVLSSSSVFQWNKIFITSKGTVYAGDKNISNSLWVSVKYNIQSVSSWSDLATAANNDATYTDTSYSGGTVYQFMSETTGTDPVDALYVTEGTSTIDGTSNTIYAGGTGGLNVIQEKRADEGNGSTKFYTKDYISEEQIGDIRGMWPLSASGAISMSDASVKADTLTNNATATFITGVRGGGVSLNGTTQYLSCTDAACGGTSKLDYPGSGGWTMGAWINPSSVAAGTAMVIAKDTNTGNRGWGLGRSADKAYFEAASAAIITGSSSMSTGKWYYIVVTYDGTNARLYLNGALEGGPAAATMNSVNDAEFSIGRRQFSGAENYFAGTIDEPFVTAEALSAAQVKHMYEVGLRALQNHTANRVDSVTADSYQELQGSTDIVKAVAVDPNGGYIYAGTNSGTDTGGVSVIGTESDTLVEQFLDANNSDDDGTAFNADDIVAISVSGGPASGYNSNTNPYSEKATLAIGTDAEAWMQTEDISVQDQIDSLAGGITRVEDKAYSALSAGNFQNSSDVNLLYNNMRLQVGQIRSDTSIASLGAGGSVVVETVTFPVTFDTILVGTAVYAGGTGTGNGWVDIRVNSAPTTSQLVILGQNTNFSTGVAADATINVDWMAVGTYVPPVEKPGTGYMRAGADLAEWYATLDETLEPGRIVSSDPYIVAGVEGSKAPYDSGMLGIVATQPGLILGPMDGSTPGYAELKEQLGGIDPNSIPRSVPIALAGRVPVKVDPKSAPIKPGDFITASGRDGMGMKATKMGYVVGKALESWTPHSTSSGSATGKDTVLVFVNLSVYLGDMQIASNGNLETSTLENSYTSTQAAGQLVAPESTPSASLTTAESTPSASSGQAESAQLAAPAEASGEGWVEATQSSTLTPLTSSNLPLENLEVDFGTFFKDLSVLGKTVLGETGITGKLTAGLLSLNGLDGSINSLGPLKFQTSLGGGVEIDLAGSINLLSGIIRGNDSFRGAINVGTTAQTSQRVDTSWQGTPVSITTTPTWNTNVWVTDIDSTGFTVNFGTAPDKESKVYWFALW